MHRNIELKARCNDLARAAARSIAIGAREAGILNQIDRYYRVPNGRLKLRTINNDRSELIQYHRDDTTDVRQSNYQILRVDDPRQLDAILAQSLGGLVEVRKRRQLLLWENVRIHLDEVEELGSFIEFEAVIGPAADEAISRRRVEQLRAALQITDSELIDSSYSNLLFLKRAHLAAGEVDGRVGGGARSSGSTAVK